MSNNSFQLSLLPDEDNTNPVKQPKKLTLDKQKLANISRSKVRPDVEGIPTLVLPTRWELLQPKIGTDPVSLQTIVRPVPQAIQIVRNIASYLMTTSGCQVLVIRADTGSGKTTFLNPSCYLA